MADFYKKGRPDGRRPSFGSKRPGGFRSHTERSFSPKELYDAECNSCHKPTQVPFRPNGKKPVYCRDCFQPDTARPRERTDRERRPAAPVADKRIDDLKHQLDTLTASIERLTFQVQKLAQSSELGAEVRKLVPDEAATKKAPVKSARKVAKKK